MLKLTDAQMDQLLVAKEGRLAPLLDPALLALMPEHQMTSSKFVVLLCRCHKISMCVIHATFGAH